jgi:four helix bundle protein
MNPKAEALKKRTHDFFMQVIQLCRTVARNTEGISITAQLVDAAGSTDSNYGAACKGRTRKQFIDKVGIAAEEADESKRWLEALRDAGLGNRDEVERLIKEADEDGHFHPFTQDRPAAARGGRAAESRAEGGARAQSAIRNPLIRNPLIRNRRSAIRNHESSTLAPA